VDKTLRCDCGFQVSGRRLEALAGEVRRHAGEAHGMELSYDEAMVLVLDAPDTVPRETGSATTKEEP